MASSDLTEMKPCAITITNVNGEGKYLGLHVQFDNMAPKQIEQKLAEMAPILETSSGYMHQCQLPIGTNVLTRFSEDPKWYRATIENWPPLNHQLAYVKLIDYGNTEYASVQDIRKAEEFFLSLSPQATPCLLADCQSSEGTWLQDKLDIIKSMILFKEAYGIIIGKYESLPILRVYKDSLTFSSTLISQDLAIPLINSDNVRSVPKPTQIYPPGLPARSLMSKSTPLPVQMIQSYQNSYYTGETYQSLSLQENQLYRVYISHIQSPIKFYVELVSSEMDRNIINQSIQTYMSQNPSRLESSLVGTPCIAQAQEDGYFSRALIMSNGQTCKVYFVDKGITESKLLSDIKAIPRSFIALPMLAHECSLEGGNNLDVKTFRSAVAGKVFDMKVLFVNGTQHVVQLYHQQRNFLELLSPLVQPNQTYRYAMLSLESSYNVIIETYSNLKEFFAQLDHNQSLIKDLMDKMKSVYDNQPEPIQENRCQIGAPICVKFGPLLWYRSEIIGPILNRDVPVRFVDFGGSSLVPISHCRPLLPQFFELPVQAIRFALKGFERLPQSLVEAPKLNKLFEKLTKTGSLQIEVVGVLQERYYAANLYNTTHKVHVNEEIMSLMKGGSNSIVSPALSPIPDKIEIPKAVVKEREKLTITNVVSGTDFFGQLSHLPFEQFEQFEEKMQQAYANLAPQKMNLSPGQYVCARFSENGVFYRAFILSIAQNKAEVFYVDYGNQEVLEYTSIFPLSPGFAQLPRLGIKCAFKDPLINTPDEKLVELMQDYIIEVDVVQRDGDKYLVRLTDVSDNAPLLKCFKQAKLEYKEPVILFGKPEQIVIHHATDYSSFYGQLQRSSNQLDDLMNKIEEHYSVSKRDNLDYPVVNSPCIAKYKVDESWYRGLIISSERGLFHVVFVDYGNSEWIDKTNLRKILPGFMELPLQAAHCCLSGKNPGNGDKFKDKVVDNEFTAIFHNKSNDRYKVDLKDLQGQNILSSLSQPEPTVINHVSFDYTYLQLKEKSFAEIQVVHVISPSEFYSHVLEFGPQLTSLVDKMNSVYKGRPGEPLNRPQIDDPCAALSIEDGTWYRARIHNILGHNMEVFYVDYGNLEILPKDHIKVLQSPFFQLEVQGVKCSLFNTLPPNGDKWNDDALDSFADMTLNNNMVAQFVHSKGKNSFEVKLINMSNLEAKALNHEFVKSGHGRLASSPPVEEKVLIPSPQIKIGSKENVLIVWVISPVEFYCQLETSQSSFSASMENMQKSYNQLKPSELNLEQFQIGSFCVTQFSEDKAWYRAKISHVKGDKIGLFYCDYGNSEEVSRKNVKKLKKEFATMPIQAFHCAIRGLKSDQRPQADLIEKYFSGNTVCTFQNRTGDKYIVDFESNGKSVALAMIHDSVAVADGTVAFPKEPVLSFEGSLSKTTLGLNREESVTVIYVESPSNFFIQKTVDLSSLETLMDKINTHYNAGKGTKPDQVSTGKTYVTKYSEDQRWYRVVIVPDPSLSNTEVLASFVDYGNTEKVQKGQVYNILPEFCQHPIASVECKLQDTPSNLSPEQVDAFYERVDGHEFVLKATKRDQDVYEVILKDKHSSIAEEIFGSVQTVSQTQSTSYKKSILSKKNSPGYVSHSNGPNDFYIQLADNDVELLTFAEKLQELASALPPLPQNLFQIGQTCLSLFSEDESWYRAEIIATKLDNSLKDRVLVRFVDYGNTDKVAATELKLLRSDLLEVSPYAYHCTLPGFIPAGKENEAKEMFNQLTEIQDLIINPLNAKSEIQTVDLIIGVQDVGRKMIEAGLLMELAEKVIPGGSCPGYVSHASGLDDFYVQLAKQADELLDFVEVVQETAEQLKQMKVSDALKRGLCLSQFSEDEAWYRAEIINSKGDNVEVRFIDYGNTDKASKGSLKLLNDVLSEKKPFAIRCCLEGVVPMINKAVESAELFNQLTENQDLLIIFVKKMGDGFSVKLNVKGEDLGDKIMSAGLGMSPTQPKQENSEAPAIVLDPFTALPSSLEDQEVTVSFTENFQSIFLHLTSQEGNLNNLTEVLEDFYGTGQGTRLLNIVPGSICCAQFSEDEAWYRAKILSLEGENYYVQFIDFGNCSTVNQEAVKELTTEYLTFPPFALECSLRDAETIDDKETEALDAFAELTQDQILKVVSVQTGEGPVSVSLTIEGQDVLETLVKMELLTIKEPETASEGSQDVLSTVGTSEISLDIVVDIKTVSSDSENVPSTPETTSETVLIALAAQTPSITSNPSYTHLNDPKTPVTTSYPKPVFPVKQKTYVTITHIESLRSFHLQLTSDSPTLDQLAQEIADAYESRPEESETMEIQPGFPCMSLYSEDESWYRSEVIQLAGDKLEVFFVDYGNKEWVTIDSIRFITPELLEKSPLAFNCGLSGLEDRPESCIDGALIKFQEIALDEGKTLLCEFQDRYDDEGRVLVKLLDVGVSLAQKIFEEEMEEEDLKPLGDEEVILSENGVLEEIVSEVQEVRNDCSTLPKVNRENKMVPGIIALGQMQEPESETEEFNEEIKTEEKILSGYFSHPLSELPDEQEEVPLEGKKKDVPITENPKILPRPASREAELVPGRLSRGLMEEDMKELIQEETREAYEQTPKGREAKILPGTLNNPDQGLEVFQLSKSIDRSSEVLQSVTSTLADLEIKSEVDSNDVQCLEVGDREIYSSRESLNALEGSRDLILKSSEDNDVVEDLEEGEITILAGDSATPEILNTSGEEETKEVILNGLPTEEKLIYLKEASREETVLESTKDIL